MTARDFAKARRRDQTRQAIRDLWETERIERELKLRTAPILSNQEIKRRLAWIKASDQAERNARRHVGFNTVSRLTGYSRDYLYKIVNAQRIPTINAQRKLSAAFEEIKLLNLYTMD